MKKISKEITKSSVIDFDFERHEHKKILTHTEKYSQFSLKMKYWNYFKYGQERLIGFMKIFQERIKANDRVMGTGQERKNQTIVDDKIKKYILGLEKKISQNLHDVKVVNLKIKNYRKGLEEESQKQ